MSNTKSPKAAILARRARFLAAAVTGIATVMVAGSARADDASTDASASDASQETDGSKPIPVEAGVRSDAAANNADGSTPGPCLSVPFPKDDDDRDHDCAAAPGPKTGSVVLPALVGAAAVVAAVRRRKKKRER